MVDAAGLTTLWTDTDLVGNPTSGYLDPGRSLVFTVTLRATAPIADGTIDVTTAPAEYGTPATTRGRSPSACAE